MRRFQNVRFWNRNLRFRRKSGPDFKSDWTAFSEAGAGRQGAGLTTCHGVGIFAKTDKILRVG
jgi:hypothetical protein